MQSVWPQCKEYIFLFYFSGFECVFCNFVCKTKNMFERHLQIHLITRMFECDVCHKFMKTPEQLLEHKKCHTVPTGGLK